MAGVAGLEPVTSAVTGQRSNQLSYTPAKGKVKIKNIRPHVKVCFVAFSGIFSKPENYSRVLLAILLNKSGQQTPRRWGWGTPLKKRAATRIRQCYRAATICQPPNAKLSATRRFANIFKFNRLPGNSCVVRRSCGNVCYKSPVRGFARADIHLLRGRLYR